MSKCFNKKRVTILKSPGVPRCGSVPQQRVRFQLPSLQLDQVFSSFTKRENTKPYEELVLTLRDSELQDGDLEQLLHCVRQCVPVLDESLHHFVNAFLKIKWLHRSDGVVVAYQDFLVELVSAHNYYIVSVLEALVSGFSEVLSSNEWEDSQPTQKEVDCYARIHSVLLVLLKVVPMSGEKLVQAVVKKFPYLKVSPHEQESFLYNVMHVVDQQPMLAKDLMLLVVSRLVALDVSMPCSSQEEGQGEVFQMEDPGSGHTLDVLMCALLHHVRKRCSTGWEGAKTAYSLQLHAFERAVLPTHATGYAQFLMFYACSFRLTLAEAFIDFLWRVATAISRPSVIRQAAATYLASFLARASYVTLNMLKSTLAEMAAWIHKYISNQEDLESVNLDVRLHDLTFLQSLGLAQMVTCVLNPLRVCQPVLVRRFAAVTRTHQLAYCYTVMERNARSTMPVIYMDDMGLAVSTATYLEAVFPYDPLHIPRCRSIIAPFYREFDDMDLSEDEPNDVEEASGHLQEDNDDFLDDMSLGTSAPEMLSVSMQ
ncbi:RNA polymerase I-specific transcription initiation factor RRN3 isoform X2 [Bacillus rossius redtenbacheri]|uniref:RNA polymerase I-specific transcription initiation factor RRN3 isoform X2 n=1 Tax=Bacillus rossius redtenbacheri TaxID=93214 RepID=UPI002FDD4934